MKKVICLFSTFTVAAGMWLAMSHVDMARAQVMVDCNTGGSVQATLDSGVPFLQFTGICNEFVSVRFSNDVVILGGSGNPALDVITGGLFVQGVHARLNDFTVRGSGLGFVNSAAGIVTNVTVENSTDGLLVLRSSHVTLDGVTITPTSGHTFINCVALCVGESSHARVFRTTITDNNSLDSIAPVFAFRNSSITIREGTVITNNGVTDFAVAATGNSDIRIDVLVPAGGAAPVLNDGIFADIGSVVDIRAGTITGPIEASLNSTVSVGTPRDAGGLPEDISITSDIVLSFGSSMRVLSAETVGGTSLATLNGTVTCADAKSSFAGDFDGTLTVDCTDFDGKKFKAK